jgi:hypothetical protein
MYDIIDMRKGGRTQTNVTVAADQPYLLIGAASTRKSVVFQNQGSVTVFIGPSTVAISGATRGYALFAGASFTDDASDQDWWGIAASTSAIVNVIQVC